MRSARARIGIAFSLLALVLFSAIGVISAQEARHRSEQQTAATLQQLAERLAQRLDADMAGRYRDVAQLVAIQGVLEPGLDPVRWRSLLDQLQASMRHYSWIGVASADGTVLAATAGLLVGADVRQRPWFINGMQHPAVGDVHDALLLASLLPSSGSKEPQRFVDVAAPLKQGGRAVGVVGAHLSWAWAEERRREALALLSGREQVEIVLVDGNGAIVLGPALPALQTGTKAPAEAGTLRWSDGSAYLTASASSRPYADYPGMGWTVVVRQPVSTAFAAADALQQRLWLIGLFGALVFGAVGWWLAGRLTDPLRQVARRAQALSDAAPALGSEDEVDQLAASLATLIERLHERERALTAANAELETRVRLRTESLQRANDDLKAFSASVSHDLRGPLGSIAMVLSSMLTRNSSVMPDSVRHTVQLVINESERLCQLTAELLSLALVEQSEFKPVRVDTAELVNAALQEVRLAMPQAAPLVQVGPLPAVTGDAVMLRQVWSNLIGNAFKFSAKVQQARVEISAREDGDEIVFTVADNGAGFDMAKAARLFGAFQRLHNSSAFPGTGLGLSIVRRVLQRHGGRAWAESQPGQGARFHFALARGETVLDELERAHAEDHRATTAAP